MRRMTRIAAPAAALFCLSMHATAAPVLVDEEKGIALNVGALVQPTLQVTAPAGSKTESAAGIGSPEKNPNFDFYLRRVRLLVYGNITKELSFFADTDQPNLAKNGDYTGKPMFMQDAFLTYSFMPEFKLDAGMMLVPLSHHTIESAAGLNALDYHSTTIFLPATQVFRDTGVQFRGVVADKLAYRLGIFEGVRYVPPAAAPAAPAPGVPAPAAPPILNPSGLPRIAGQVRFNLMGAENDFFLKGIYFTPTPIVSVGLGLDYQGKALNVANAAKDNTTISVDAYLDYPFSADDELVFKTNFFMYSKGATLRDLTGNATAMADGGKALYAEVGFRHTFFEPILLVDWAAGNDSNYKYMAPHLGVNFWINKYTFNTKIDLAYQTTEKTALNAMTMMNATLKTADVLGTVQAQVFF
jgi:hypothetical protein